MAKRFKAGVIGCGSIAQMVHLPGYVYCRGVELAASCDPVRGRRTEARRISDRLRTYEDYHEMLDAEQLDVVSVASPNRFHAEHAIAALEHGTHVLLEKPAALSMKEIARIKSAVRKSGRKLIVGFTYRFARGNQRIHRLLADGAIGVPFMIRIRLAHGGPYPGWAKSDWFYNPKHAGGGALLDMGIHAIDQAIWQLGPVKSVRAVARTLRKNIKVEDNAVLLLEFTGGKALGYIEVGWTSPSGFCGIEIMGDQGSIVADYAGQLRVTTGKITPNLKGRPKLRTRVADRNPMHGSWSTEVAEVVRAFRNNDDLGIGIDAGGQALAVALAAYESSRTGRRIAVAK